MTILVDVLHPWLALRLLLRGRSDRRLYYFLRMRGRLTDWLIALLARRYQCCQQWDLDFADPTGGNANLWHPSQKRLAVLAAQLLAGLSARIQAAADTPEGCHRRFVGWLAAAALDEIQVASAVLMAAARDLDRPGELYLTRCRFEFLLGAAAWPCPAGLTLRRHRMIGPGLVQVRPGYYMGGGQLNDTRASAVLRLLGQAAFCAIGALLAWRDRHAKRPAAHPLAVFIPANEVGRMPMGFDWLDMVGQPMLGLAAVERAADIGPVMGLQLGATAPFSFGRGALKLPRGAWAGFGGWMIALWRARPRTRLPLRLMPWVWASWLDLSRREAFFAATLQRHGSRLVWMVSQFDIGNSTAASSAMIRLGGEAWGCCATMLDNADTFALRLNAQRVFTWGRRDAALYAAAGMVEWPEASGYPGDIASYRQRGAELRKALGQRGFTRVVALYDNNFGPDVMNGARDYAALFSAARAVLDRVPGTCLVVKGKDRKILLRGLGEDGVAALEADSRVVLDYERASLAPAFAADVVMSIMLSSTGCVASAAGIPTFSLDAADYQNRAEPVGIPAYRFCPDAASLIEAVVAVLQEAPQQIVPDDTYSIANGTLMDPRPMLAATAREWLVEHSAR